MDTFAGGWEVLFDGDPPNASISGTVENGTFDIHLIELTNPLYDWMTNRMTFTATMLSGDSLDGSTMESPVLFIDSSNAASQDHEYPYGETCESLSTATWDEVSLYDLTYGCIPAGWSEFVNLKEIRERVADISQSLKVPHPATGPRSRAGTGNRAFLFPQQ